MSTSFKVSPTVDDYPFLYVRDRGVPGLYIVTLGLIALTSLIAVRASVGRFSKLKPYADLFALGAAFLLLETKAWSSLRSGSEQPGS